MMRKRKREAGDKPATPEEMYRGLRSMVLTSAAEMTSPSPEHPDVAGLVVDIPSKGGYATIVSLADNTTSMYTSTGGGTIGAGEHTAVAQVTQVLLAVVRAHLDEIGTHPDTKDLPPAGSVRIHVLMSSGSRSLDVPEAAFWGQTPHALVPVIGAIQNVVTAIRGLSPPG